MPVLSLVRIILIPLKFQVDFGDGSGISTWTRENAQDLWRHSYSQAGNFIITVVVTGVYDLFVQTDTVNVIVTETVTATDPVEIICPDVIHPGDYFNCVVDIPTGYDLKAEIKMTDDLDLEMSETTSTTLTQTDSNGNGTDKEDDQGKESTQILQIVK